jgi:hypothetical protein
MRQVRVQSWILATTSVVDETDPPSGASSRSLTCAATGNTDMTSAVAVSVVSEASSRFTWLSAGLAHAAAIDLREDERRRDDDRSVVI